MAAASLLLNSSDATSLRFRRLGSFWGSASRFSCSARDVMLRVLGKAASKQTWRKGSRPGPLVTQLHGHTPPPPSSRCGPRCQLPPRGAHRRGSAGPSQAGKKLNSGRRLQGTRSRSSTPTWLRAAPLHAGPHVSCAHR